MTEIGRIIVTGGGNENGRIAIVYGFVHQIPGKCGTVVGRHPHIVKLIGRVEAVHRTRHHIVRHHIVLQHQGAITDIGIGAAVLEQVIPRAVKYPTGIGRHGDDTRIYGVRRFVIEKISAARRQDG